MARKKKKPASKKKRKSSGKKAPKKAPKKAAKKPSKKAPPKAAEKDTAPTEAAPVADPDDGEHSLVDLDADDTPVVDPDAGEAPAAAVEQLIAETLAAAKVEDDAPEPHEPGIDLDADLDGEADVATVDAEAAPDEPVEASTEPSAQGAADRPVTDESSARGDTGDATAAERAIRALIDLGPVSSPEVRDRLLAQALAHAEHQDARYRVPFLQAPTAGRWKAVLALVIVLVAGAVAAVPPEWTRPDPPAQLRSADRALNLRVALLLQAQQVEAFRVRTQQLPASLDEVTRTLPGVRYVRSGSRAYQLIAYEADGSALVYDSADPTPPFAITTAWAPRESAR